MTTIATRGTAVALLALAGAAAVQAGAHAAHSAADLPDCVCNTTWTHDEYNCRGNPTGINGCPTLETLAMCENAPKESWCATTNAECKGQSGDSVGDGWVYCDPEDNGAPVLPHCTCKTTWQHKEGRCAEYQGGARMNSCPTIEELRECNPSYKWTDQSWCETEEEACLEQEDWYDSYAPSNETYMVGAGWAYCDPVTKEPELPNCDCGDSETGLEQWTPVESECPGFNWKTRPEGPVFSGCTTPDDYLAACGQEPNYDQGVDLPWCYTMQGRCKQQSTSTYGGFDSMVGDYWSYCDVETDVGVYPTCECKDEWMHDEEKCAGKGMALEQKGCPTIGSLGLCETNPEYSWCETTYDTCGKQSDSELGEAWAYCDTKTQEAELPPCECEASWTNKEGDGEWNVCTAQKVFRGCPSLEELQECEPDISITWCYTTDRRCREQVGPHMINEGWATCDPVVQRAVKFTSKKDGMGGAIAITFVATFLLCIAVFALFLTMYQKFLQTNRWRYSQKLMETGEESGKL